MDYILLSVALAVTCFAGVQLCYLMFLQATIRQQRRRIAELERELIAVRQAAAEPPAPDTGEDEEAWAELIDDGTS